MDKPLPVLRGTVLYVYGILLYDEITLMKKINFVAYYENRLVLGCGDSSVATSKPLGLET
jgi:hypothetical protein